MSRRRSSRRRKPPQPAAPSADTGSTDTLSDTSAAPQPARAGYGKAALVLALLLGALLEGMATAVLSGSAQDAFHLAIGVGIAFLVARWYRNFMRRTLTNARANRQDRRSR